MFIDRNDAAQQLVQQLAHLKNEKNLIVLAIPRGGLAIGAIVAQELNAPLDVVLAKKIGAPYNSELAIGAATPQFYFIDPMYEPITPEIKQEIADVQNLLQKRALAYRQGRATPALENKIVIIVDDGIATGHTMRAAIKSLRELKPAKIIVVAPVISLQTAAVLDSIADQVISVLKPADMTAIGAYYQHFEQVSDQTAQQILQNYKQ